MVEALCLRLDCCSLELSLTTLIDLNCDMGEFDFIADAELDLAIMPLISRCNIAIGGHAGNEDTISYCFEQASKHNLSIGIHPSYADRANFGRKIVSEPWQKTIDDIAQQIELGINTAIACGIKLSHIKLHGALYNQVEVDEALAAHVAELFAQYDLAVLGMANGQLKKACSSYSLEFINEAFIDRRYNNVSQLQPRSESGSVFTSEQDIVSQACAIAVGEPIQSADKKPLKITADSLCIHSDTPNAMQFLQAIRTAFSEQDIHVS